MRTIFTVLSLSALACSGLAQSTLMLPSAATGGELAESTRSPFARNPAERVLYVYDTSHFAGVTTPIRIERLRLRADGAAANWLGDAQGPVTVDMSTATRDYLDASTTFEDNHGADRLQAFSGTATFASGVTTGSTTGPFVVDLVLSTPFVYFPGSGKDLVLDFVSVGLPSSANVVPFDASKILAVGRATSIQSESSGATTGGLEPAALAVELTYTAATGLFPAFSVDVAAGPSPLAVQFTDLSYSSDAGGITGWAWDFDNDGTVDSTLQNPGFSYTSCGASSVALTVTDASGSATALEVDLIQTDGVEAEFAVSQRNGPATLVVDFFDASTGSPTTWSWDFDGDGLEDSTLQNPQFSYTAPGAYDVTLTVTRNCQADTLTKVQHIVVSEGLTTIFLGNNGIDPPGGVFFDAVVTNPAGLQVTALEQHVNEVVGAPFTLDVYLTGDSFVGKDGDVSVWRKVASGTALSNGLNNRTFVDISDFYLPPGAYGIAIYLPDARQRYTNGNGTNQAYADANLSLTLGRARDDFFTGSAFEPRVWNGSVFYSTNPGNVYNPFAEGCPHSGGIARIDKAAGVELRVGQPFAVDVSNLPAGTGLVFLTLGYNNASWNGVPLPVDLGFLGMVGCVGRAEPFETIPLFAAGGVATWNVVVPALPVFGGTPIFNQALIIDPLTPAPNTLGAVLSDPGAGVVGF